MDKMLIFVRDTYENYLKLKAHVNWSTGPKWVDRVVFWTTDTKQMFRGEMDYTSTTKSGSGSPQGKITNDSPGSLYVDTSTSTGTALYFTADGNSWIKVGVSGQEFSELNEKVNEINIALNTLEDDDVITDPPSISLSASKIASVEVGTEVSNVTFTVSKNDGTYEYGPDPTGVTFGTPTVTFGGVVVSSGFTPDPNTDTDGDGTNDKFLVLDDTSIVLKAVCSHSAGSIPKSNLGRSLTEASAIAAGSKQATRTLKGFRYAFAGQLNDKTTALSSSVIHGLSVKDKDKSLTINTTSSALRVVIAFPATWGSLTSVLDKNDSNKNIISAFTQLDNVDVQGATAGANLMSYKVYVMTFASAYGSSNTYTATIS